VNVHALSTCNLFPDIEAAFPGLTVWHVQRGALVDMHCVALTLPHVLHAAAMMCRWWLTSTSSQQWR
jgi:hypothetical protein